MAKKGKNKHQKSTNLGKKPIQEKVTQKVAQRTTASRPKPNAPVTFLFGRINYIYMLAGAACLGIGLVLMSGGAMESPDVWDNDKIYSFRRITLAPILMIIGLIMEIMAIFKRD